MKNFGVRVEFRPDFLNGISLSCQEFSFPFQLNMQDKKNVVSTHFIQEPYFPYFVQKAKFLDFLRIPYNPISEKDIEKDLTNLVSTLARKRKILFEFAVLSFEEGISKKIIKKNTFLREHPKKRISGDEFRKIIESVQKNSFYEAKKKSLMRFDIEVINAMIKKVVIDDKIVVNPIGFTGKQLYLEIVNLYTPANFYKVIKKIFQSQKTKFIFFD